MKESVAIVLTASITPAVNFVAVTDPHTRRNQYIDALAFYSQFAPVYFLENSAYDLANDSAFTSLSNVEIRKFAMLPESDRGKGYQEFAMLDAWHQSESQPPKRFLKITGRYRIENVADLLEECRDARESRFLVDRYSRKRLALTSYFSASWRGYGQIVNGLFREMDDACGMWAERVLYDALTNRPDIHSFAHEPDICGISGSTGRVFDRSRWRWGAKQLLRSALRIADRSELHFRG